MLPLSQTSIFNETPIFVASENQSIKQEVGKIVDSTGVCVMFRAAGASQA
jgi:hypothetical protein